MIRIPEISASEQKRTASVILSNLQVLLPSGITGNPADAIARLKATLPVYSELQHENLIELVEAKDIGGGFAMVFKWATGDCMGRMWGSSLFQSPEEYEVGAVIDEITNVYTVGATAFALFGEYNRNRDRWQLSDKLFEVAAKAVSADRNGRQQSIRQLREEWEMAIRMES